MFLHAEQFTTVIVHYSITTDDAQNVAQMQVCNLHRHCLIALSVSLCYVLIWNRSA